MPTVAPSNFASPSSQLAPVVVDSAATWDRACLNCGTALAGPFCSECGQRAVPPHPSLRELAGDAFAEFSGWDGKLATSVRALLFHPGRLTLEFIEGRRARYIAPLRLYLVASVVYFALSAAAPEQLRAPVVRVTERSAGPSIKVTTPGKADPEPDPDFKSDGSRADRAEIDSARAKLLAAVAAAPAIVRPTMRYAVADQQGFRNDLFNSIPKALFVLMPVFAGILKLFYTKRRYAEHLYFALHAHALGFAAFSVAPIVRFTHWARFEQAIGILILIGVPIYWHRAIRRVYGGSFGATLLKETGVSVLYGIASVPVMIGLAIWVSRSH